MSPLARRLAASIASIQQRSENVVGDAGEAAFRLTPTAFVLGFPDEVGGIKTGTYSLDQSLTVVGRVAQRRSLSRHLLFVDLIDGPCATTRAQIILQQQQLAAAGDMKEIKVGAIVAVRGQPARSRHGNPSLQATDWSLVRPPSPPPPPLPPDRATLLATSAAARPLDVIHRDGDRYIAINKPAWLVVHGGVPSIQRLPRCSSAGPSSPSTASTVRRRAASSSR